MFTVGIVGHSLTPRELDIAGISVRVFRKPGATWADINCREFSGFWQSRFDLGIVVLGGNDLALVDHREALGRAQEFIDRVSSCCSVVKVCTVEPRFYSVDNRFGVIQGRYNRERNAYNRTLKRILRRRGISSVDIGTPWLAFERFRDGVHFNDRASRSLERKLGRIIIAERNSEGSFCLRRCCVCIVILVFFCQKGLVCFSFCVSRVENDEFRSIRP